MTSMHHLSRACAGAAAGVLFCLASGAAAGAEPQRAAGAFDVKLEPLALADPAARNLARLSIHKQFHGDLEAASTGEMLTAGAAASGSAGYVAIERVEGKLHGRSGTFVLQHSGTLTKGAQQLSITVVPDSGTGELAGITGKMSIVISEGKHSYVFEYTLPPAR